MEGRWAQMITVLREILSPPSSRSTSVSPMSWGVAWVVRCSPRASMPPHWLLWLWTCEDGERRCSFPDLPEAEPCMGAESLPYLIFPCHSLAGGSGGDCDDLTDAPEWSLSGRSISWVEG